MRFGLPAQEVKGTRFVMAGDARTASPAQPGFVTRTMNPSTDGGVVAEWRVSPDGTKLAYAVAEAPGGKDKMRKVWVWDIAANKRTADEILYVKDSTLAWAADSSGLYYSRYRDPSPDPEVQRFNGAQEVFFHKLGDDRLVDVRVYASDRGEMQHYAETSDDGRWIVINGSVGGNGRSEVILIDRTAPKPGPFKAIRTMKDGWQFAGSKGSTLFFVTTFGAEKNKRLVAMDTGKYSLPLTEIVAETPRELAAARIVGDRLLLSYADGARFKVSSLPAPSGK